MRARSLLTARDSAIALLSYQPDTASSVRLMPDEMGGRWLISGSIKSKIAVWPFNRAARLPGRGCWPPSN